MFLTLSMLKLLDFLDKELIFFSSFFHYKLMITRKYLLRGYILGVLTHTTAWDQHGEGDETLKCGFKIDYM